MTLKTRSEIRVRQTQRELERTREEISAWCTKWKARDKRQQFATPRRLLEEVLVRALVQLRSEIDKLPGTKSVGSVYAECARFDRNIAWVRRLWQYYALKFDQRENEEFKPVLAAADEIVWSCYAEAFQNAAGGAARGPAPLPYLEPLYSAQATPRVDIPPDLRADVDRDFLFACLEQLPISLVALPSQCVDAPWWLIFLGHEVGHHVQFDLLPPRELFVAFGKSLNVEVDKEFPGQGQRWRRWSPEIFADAYSVHAMGPWAARAMSELETKDDLAMLTENSSGKSAYPAPWVRLDFLSKLSAALDPNDRSPEVTPPIAPEPNGALLREQAEDAIKAVPKIVNTVVTESFQNLGTLQKVCGWQSTFFTSGGLVDYWAAALQGDPEALRPEKSLFAPRLIIAGAFAAWSKVSVVADDREAERARTNLIENLLSIIPLCAEEGVRAAEQQQETKPQQFADSLTSLLLTRAPQTV